MTVRMKHGSNNTMTAHSDKGKSTAIQKYKITLTG